MRRKENVLLVLVALVAVASWCLSTGAEAQVAPKEVVVIVNCPEKMEEGEFSISVSPYEAVVKQYQGIQWTITNSNSSNKNIKINAVDPRKWPYQKTTVEAPDNVQMSNMTNSTIDKVYPYEVTVFCDSYSGAIVLDPRIRVGGG